MKVIKTGCNFLFHHSFLKCFVDIFKRKSDFSFSKTCFAFQVISMLAKSPDIYKSTFLQNKYKDNIHLCFTLQNFFILDFFLKIDSSQSGSGNISEAFCCHLSFPPSDIFILIIDHDFTPNVQFIHLQTTTLMSDSV